MSPLKRRHKRRKAARKNNRPLYILSCDVSNFTRGSKRELVFPQMRNVLAVIKAGNYLDSNAGIIIRKRHKPDKLIHAGCIAE